MTWNWMLMTHHFVFGSIQADKTSLGTSSTAANHDLTQQCDT